MSDVAMWIQPIAGDVPGGRDARHEPEHERIRAELEKLTSVHGKAVDWELIRADGQTLLQSKSKDLLIAAYLAFAWAKLEGLAGLARGMRLLALLMERFPDALQPVRPRARANALTWFAERAGELPAADGVAVDAAELRGAYAALLASARAALGDECPLFNELGRSVERAALSAAAAPAAPAPAANGASLPAAAASSSNGAAPRTDAGAGALDASAWLAPIPGPARAGADATQEDAYFAVQAEIEKLQSLEGARPDWEKVRALCSELLATRSKDFALAGYLLLALAELGGLEGLALGLSALSGMLDGYWDEGFPPVQRVKRRAAVLSFVLERLALALPRIAPQRGPQAASVLQALDLLAARLSLRFPGPDAPALGPLREALNKLPEAAAASASPAPDATPVSASGPSAPPPSHSPSTSSLSAPAAASELRTPAPALAPLPTPASAPADTAALGPFLASTASSLVEAAKALFEAEPTDPRAYRLLRIGLWLELASLPPAQGDGRTRMRPPDKRARDALAALVAAARWDALLIQSEATLRTNPLWLECCWLCARALDQLGESHAAAKLAVEAESRALVRRLPQLLSLRFMDGSPLASPEAVEWLRAGTADEITPNEQASAGPPKALQSVLEAALAGGDAPAGRELELLLRGAPSAREAFQWRLAVARSVENSGKLEAAAALYLGLERDVDAHRLEEWEPELAREVFRSLWALLRRKGSLLQASDAQRICARLARLSPLALT